MIPARGGSKRIPRKNVKLFGGLPMIAWSIDAALKSECFQRIIVSTDDPEIREVAIAYGADVPFIRPPALAGDHTGTVPVISHAVDWQTRNGMAPSEVCCIYATAPFLRPNDLKYGLDTLVNSGAEYSFSVTTYAFPIQRALYINNERRVEMVSPESLHSRSQDLDEVWHDAGQFYWGQSAAWLSEKPIFTHHSVAVPIPRHRVQDIDTQEDWEHAELMFEVLRHKRRLHGISN